MPLAPEENRAFPRTDLKVHCLVGELGGRWANTILRDLSLTGFRISQNPGFRVGRVVTVRFPSLQVMICDVRWRDERDLGCSFRRPLHPYVFDHIIASFSANTNDKLASSISAERFAKLASIKR